MKSNRIFSSWNTGYVHGRMDGYADGYKRGSEIAAREASLRRSQPEGSREHLKRLKVMYVTAGIGVPYPAIDQSVIDALGALVQEVVVAMPSEPIAEIAAEQRPDLVLVLTGINITEEQVKAVRDLDIPTAVWFTDDPYYTDWTRQIALRYHYVFTLESACAPYYQQLGCMHVYHLPLGVNPRLYAPAPSGNTSRYEICFIGTAFWNRVQTIDALASYLAQKNTLISGWWWDRLAHYPLLRSKILSGEWLSPEETSQYYGLSRIVLNIHRRSDDDTLNHNGDRVPAHSINPRTFEISACNTLQITDYREDLPRYYEIGKEIVTYTSVHELRELLDYYSRHEQERCEIARRGYERTIRDHTYVHRLEVLLRTVFG